MADILVKKIACIGAGYVGGPTMAMIALNCPEIEVVVVDINEARIKAWNSDKLPIYEPGLDEVVKAARGRNLFFSTDTKKHVGEADVVFVSVNTPTKTTGIGAGRAADLTYWEGAARLIASVSTGSKIVVEKSTVPVKTAEAIGKVLKRNCSSPGVNFEILSNPEFLAEGTAIEDLRKPDRVAHAIGTDSRIGPKFLNASVGFGGSCFQKDILNLCYVCETLNLKEVADYWAAVVTMNDYQKQRFVERVLGAMFNTVANKKIAVMGFAFKKDTGDTRETPAIDVCKGLIRDGAKVSIFDPQVTSDQVFRDLSTSKFEWDRPDYSRSHTRILDNVKVCSSPTEAMEGSHAICVLTEWDEFKTYDYQAVYDKMCKPAFVFDGRNILDHDKLREIGFIVYALGKPLDPFLQKNY
ncbi:UDP-glucose 6-dehydrogenase, partial [Haematococcus lacustris]